METLYRKLYLKDLKKLKNQEVYSKIHKLSFEIIPKAQSIGEIPNIKAMKSHPGRYRIRIGDYRIGIEVEGDRVEFMRVLHRKEFYRYFP